jgi:hypothetical protein
MKNLNTTETANSDLGAVSDSIYYIYDEVNKKYYAGIPNTHDVFSKYKSEANIYKTKEKAQKHIDEIKDYILKKHLVVTMTKPTPIVSL